MEEVEVAEVLILVQVLVVTVVLVEEAEVEHKVVNRHQQQGKMELTASVEAVAEAAKILMVVMVEMV
jgi:hypothetical protein